MPATGTPTPAPSPDEARAVYAEQLVHATALIVGAVHDEGPTEVRLAIDHALILPAPADVDPMHAIVTVLAAQVDPETTAADRFGWLASTPRSLTRRPDDPDPTLDAVDYTIACALDPDPGDVDYLALAVIAKQIEVDAVPYATRVAAVEILRARGASSAQTAELLGYSTRYVKKLRAAHRQATTGEQAA